MALIVIMLFDQPDSPGDIGIGVQSEPALPVTSEGMLDTTRPVTPAMQYAAAVLADLQQVAANQAADRQAGQNGAGSSVHVPHRSRRPE